MENTDTTTLPGASSSEETPPVKSHRKPPLSFRPKGVEMQEFLDNLLKELGSPQKVIEHCVNIAMMPEAKHSGHALKEKEDLKKVITELEAELAKRTGIALPPLQFGDDQEKFIQRIIDKKKTNREEAIKFCIIYTKDNILWF